MQKSGLYDPGFRLIPLEYHELHFIDFCYKADQLYLCLTICPTLAETDTQK